MSKTPAPITARKTLTGTKIGVVTSDKRHQTRTVTVAYARKHPKYGKFLRLQTRLQVHDPENQAHVGDRVEIASCRPISKTKMWRLVRVVEKAPVEVLADTQAPQIG
ncbi:MAG: 30S ribosomal protein S17 [Phycisphaeraceae bacterium]|nr:30S ribosomal protein S17 [Phycisphaeraceae bacterium]